MDPFAEENNSRRTLNNQLSSGSWRWQLNDNCKRSYLRFRLSSFQTQHIDIQYNCINMLSFEYLDKISPACEWFCVSEKFWLIQEWFLNKQSCNTVRKLPILISNNWKTVHVEFTLCKGKLCLPERSTEKLMQNQKIYLAQSWAWNYDQKKQGVIILDLLIYYANMLILHWGNAIEKQIRGKRHSQLTFVEHKCFSMWWQEIRGRLLATFGHCNRCI